MPVPQFSPAVLAAVHSNNIRFSHYILIILTAMVMSVAIYQLVVHSIRYIRTLACLKDDGQEIFRISNRSFGLTKQHLLDAPLFSRRHSKQMHLGPVEMGILPTRFQSFLIAGIIIMNVALCAYGIEWHGVLVVKLTHLQNRSGTLAVVNMIPLVVMAGRNNPLIALLNISFDTFNLLHRWFGRIVVSLAVTHGVVVIINIVTGATAGQKVHPSGVTIFTNELKEERFMLWGFVAFVAMITIILTSFTSFRHAFYETFLHIHIALVSLILAALWIHLKGLEQLDYVKAVTALWVIERLVRLSLLLYRNIGRQPTTADIEVLPGEALRVTLHLARPCIIGPGQHIFLTIPSIGLWTSHPFSIAWSERTTPPSTHATDPEKHPSPNEPTTSTLSQPQTSLSLLIRRRSGLTSHLYHHATSKPSISAFIEGPYGTPTPLTSYGTVLLFAGGVGITHQLPRLRALLAAHTSHAAAIRRLSLVWILRSSDHLEWIRPWLTTLLAMSASRDILSIQIFITRPGTRDELQFPDAAVQMFAGRPDVGGLVETECEERVGAMAVGVCGPGGLGDEVREAVRGRCAGANVDFEEEGFGW